MYNDEKCYKEYFRTWGQILSLEGFEGNTEYMRLQAEEMKREALELNNEQGLIIAYIAMAQAYSRSWVKKEENKALKILHEALSLPGITLENKHTIYSQINTININHEDYKEYINILDTLSLIRHKMMDNPLYAKNMSAGTLLEDELKYCNVYSKTNDTANLKKHLEKATQYYSKDVFYNYYMSYHNQWGKYYYALKQYDKALEQFNIALDRMKESVTFFKLSIMMSKAQTLFEMQQFKESALLNKTIALKIDSIVQTIEHKHEDANKANFIIKHNILENEKRQKTFHLTIIVIIVIILLFLILAIKRLLTTRKQLNVMRDKITNSYQAIEAANKLKEVFLRNIINEISKPLSEVVTLSDKLCHNNNLSPEDVSNFSIQIKESSNELLTMITNILDLSRLESGMMKFNIEQYNVVQICQDCCTAIKMEENPKLTVKFDSSRDELFTEVDVFRFNKMLLSVMQPPKPLSELCQLVIKLEVEAGNLRLTINNSPLTYFSGQDIEILHEINRLYLNKFNGFYQISGHNIIITYPLHK